MVLQLELVQSGGWVVEVRYPPSHHRHMLVRQLEGHPGEGGWRRWGGTHREREDAQVQATWARLATGVETRLVQVGA